jgi:hypothetical protein
MITTIVDKQMHDGRRLITERVWVASNGHKVTVKQNQNITSRGSIIGNSSHWSRVAYVCECGNELHTSGNPKKAALDSHDSWTTPAQIAHINKMLSEMAGA